MQQAPAEMAHETQVSVRLPADVPDRAEALAAALADHPDFRAFRMSRSAVLRRAMLEGLRVLEERHAASEPADAPKRKAGGSK